MPIDTWYTNPDENTSVDGIDIAEHCPGRNLNNAIRNVMADVRQFANNIEDATIPDDLRTTLLQGKEEAEKLLQSQDAIDRLYVSAEHVDVVADNIESVDTVSKSIDSILEKCLAELGLSAVDGVVCQTFYNSEGE